ncbi:MULTISPECIES: FadR/GntR family transcriptional regulator [Roseobacteraceae]|uniref:FadR/GntR family transcriptional regulator n=1 Tax=Roseobacteraceae TaxID=2854170 RepID=UPI003296A5B8
MQKPEGLALGMRPKLSERVADQLRERIQKGELALGEQLPTESALVEQFGVSRTVIREAISSLRVDGLVKAHQGRGVFVCEDISQQPFRLCSKDLSEKDHMVQAMELRMCMEVTNAELAAARRTDPDIQSMEAALNRQHAAHLSGALGQTEDFAFHLAIANATQNSYMVDFLRFLGPYIIPANAMHQMDPKELPAYQNSLRAEHWAIAAAIKDGDATAAGEEMRSHLRRGLQVNSGAGIL